MISGSHWRHPHPADRRNWGIIHLRPSLIVVVSRNPLCTGLLASVPKLGWVRVCILELGRFAASHFGNNHQPPQSEDQTGDKATRSASAQEDGAYVDRRCTRSVPCLAFRDGVRNSLRVRIGGPDANSGSARHPGKGGSKGGIVVVPDGLMERISFGDRNSQVLAVARTPSHELGLLTLPTHPLVVVLDRFEKPGNLGALLRTANGAGVHAVY